MKKFIPKPRYIPFIVLGVIAIVLSVGLVLTLLQTTAPASSGNIYLEDPAVSAKKDDTVKFVVRIDPGARVDTVTATVQYDKDRLKYEKTEYTDSPFGSQIPATATDDKVTVQAAKLGGETVDGDAFIAMLLFTANESGTQTLELVDGNAAHAGIATNPTVMGKTIAHNGASTSGGSSATDNDDASDGSTSPLEAATDTLTAPITSLLETVGVSSDTAQRASLWIVGLLLCAIIAVAIVISIIVYKKKQLRKKPKTPEQGASV